MQAQTPAEGIMRTGDWGDSKAYRVACDCGHSDHSQDLWVEADDTGISVSLFVRVKSKWWSQNRWKTIWTLLTRGYVEYEATTILSNQQALNYAKTLEHAIIDVETFRNNRKRTDA
jgi:hypothetical protein